MKQSKRIEGRRMQRQAWSMEKEKRERERRPKRGRSDFPSDRIAVDAAADGIQFNRSLAKGREWVLIIHFLCRHKQKFSNGNCLNVSLHVCVYLYVSFSLCLCVWCERVCVSLCVCVCLVFCCSCDI